MNNFSVLYRCVHCAESFETVIQADYKSNAAAKATPLLHSCLDMKGDARLSQGIAHAFLIRTL